MDRELIKKQAIQLAELIDRFSDEGIEEQVKSITDELKKCSRCNRPLIVLQHLDYYPDDVCGLCQK